MTDGFRAAGQEITLTLQGSELIANDGRKAVAFILANTQEERVPLTSAKDLTVTGPHMTLDVGFVVGMNHTFHARGQIYNRKRAMDGLDTTGNTIRKIELNDGTVIGQLMPALAPGESPTMADGSPTIRYGLLVTNVKGITL